MKMHLLAAGFLVAIVCSSSAFAQNGQAPDGVRARVFHFNETGVEITEQLRVRSGFSLEITIVKDWSSTSELSRWFKAVLNGKVDRKSISIIFLNDAGEEARINLFHCWPSKWTGPALNTRTSARATESFELFFDGY